MPCIDAFAASDRGLVRANNEDAFAVHVPEDEETRWRKGVLAIVADGVGGAAGGDRASQMAIAITREHYYQSPLSDIALALQEAFRAANSAIYKAAQSDPRYLGMATTCTALVIRGGMGVVVHVGDSRAYVWQGGDLQQITQDHTLVNTLVERGLLSPAEATRHPQKNIIVKALGHQPDVSPDIYHLQVTEQDFLLLCSDGLYDLISEQEMLSILKACSAQTAVNELIVLAKKEVVQIT
jgi:PPM family protein phosphatase